MSFRDGNYELEESQCLEFKEAAGGLPRDMWETYSAFANTEGGEIVLGVYENPSTHEFSLVGVPDADKLVDDIWATVRNKNVVGNDVLLSDSVAVVCRDGLDFVVVDVRRAERDERPVEVYEKSSKSFVSYIRRGRSDLKANRDDIDRMTYDRAAEADRKVLNDYSLDSLSNETIQRYRTIFAGNKPSSPWNSDSTEDFLYHIGAIAKGRDGAFHPTRAGLLAFGFEYEITRYLPHYLLDYREETSEDNRWVDRVCSQSGDWSGNVVDFYLLVTERMLRYFKAPFSAGANGVRHNSRNPITESVNEAIANALVHAHYGTSASVKVILKTDVLEVTNSGDFLIDRDVAVAGGFSEARNPTLMRVLSLIGATDRAGSGLCAIWSVWSGYGLSPILREIHSPAFVSLSLPLRGILGSSHKGGIESTAHDDSIFALLKDHPEGVSALIVQNELSLSERVAQKALKSMADRGLLNRDKRGRQFWYVLG